MTSKQEKQKQQTDIVQLSFEFSVCLVRFIGTLPRTTEGFALGKQLIRAGTSVGANVEEAQGARTKPEFINCMNIAKREARETRYWLRLLGASRLGKMDSVNLLLEEVERLIRILTAIVKTSERH